MQDIPDVKSRVLEDSVYNDFLRHSFWKQSRSKHSVEHSVSALLLKWRQKHTIEHIQTIEP